MHLCIKITCYHHIVRGVAISSLNSSAFISALQFVGAYSEMTNKVHLTQLSFRTSTDFCSPTAHERMLTEIQSENAVSALSLLLLLFDLSLSCLVSRGAQAIL